MRRDSLDKIVEFYFSAVIKDPLTYKGKTFYPKRLIVRPSIFRSLHCPEKCGGCCPRFSLDYLPPEKHPYKLPKRKIILNGIEYFLFSDTQDRNKNHFCKNLNKENGRCSIHGKQPFSCDFELLRFLHSSKEIVLMTRYFGRGWNMKIVTGERGAKCELSSASSKYREEIIRKLERLKNWTDHFDLSTKLPEIIDWCKKGPITKPFII